MKEIIIKESNKDKIMDAIKAVQGKATVRTIDSYDKIAEIISDVEDRIGTISKKALEGTEVHYDFRQHFAKAYNGAPISTHISFVYRNGSWRVTDVERTYCPDRWSDYPYSLKLSETAKQAILKRYE